MGSTVSIRMTKDIRDIVGMTKQFKPTNTSVVLGFFIAFSRDNLVLKSSMGE